MNFLTSKSGFVRSVIASLVTGCSVAAMTPEELAARLAANEQLLVVDVRAANAYAEGHIPGAINIPLSLLPDKQLPNSVRLVVYGDGLGVVDEAKALAVARAKPGVVAEVLEGGYAAWTSATRLSTAMPGVVRERLPGITYQQLVAAGKDDMVLVDLRGPAAPATAAQAKAKSGPATAAMATDVLGDFARKLGVPVVAAGADLVTTSKSPATAAKSSGAPARAAAAIDSAIPANKLLVLVADNEAEANEVARRLRASGRYRFTILIGGTEIIRHEGRQGSGRMDGGSPVQYQP